MMGILLNNAKNSINENIVCSELFEIKNKYGLIPELIDRTTCTFFKISDAVTVLENLNFLNDELDLKNYLIEKMKKMRFF